MRISDTNLFFIHNINRNLNKLNIINQNLSTGKNHKSNPYMYIQTSRLEAQIRKSKVMENSIQDGISLIQTAHSALETAHSIGQRLKELSEMYKNGTLTNQDKEVIGKESEELYQTMQDILKKTEFNGKKLFTETGQKFSIAGTIITLPSLSSIFSSAENNQKEVSKLTTTNYKEEGSVNTLMNKALPSVMLMSLSMDRVFTPMRASIQSSIQEKAPIFKVEQPDIAIPDQGNYTGYRKVYDDKGKLIYEGHFSNGIMDGFGTLYDDGKKVYEGNFKNGIYEGYGTSFYNNGQIKYQGTFDKDGTPDGYGTYYRKNGKIVYEGYLKEGYREGWGTSFGINGKEIESKYYNDYTNRNNQSGNEGTPNTGGNGDSENDTGNTTEPPPTNNNGNNGGEEIGDNNGSEGGNGNGNGNNQDGGSTVNPPGENGANSGGNPNDNPNNGIEEGNNSNNNGNNGNGNGNEDNDIDNPQPNPPLNPNPEPEEIPPLLNPDYIQENILDVLSKGLSDLGIKERILGYRLDFEQNMQDIQEQRFNRIENVDYAKELMEQVKHEMLVETNAILLQQNLDQRRSLILSLLQA